MRWEAEEVETVLERICDLHDRISDAIHAISSAQFIRSINPPSPLPPTRGDGFVYVKDFRAEGGDGRAMEEARSLNAIRTALENLEHRLDFLHTIESHQQAERDTAVTRLEQSRVVLAMRLADHQGRKFKVIDEVVEFVDDVRREMIGRGPGENTEDEAEGRRSSVLMRLLTSGLQLARNSLRHEKVGGVLGNAALFAVSMLAMLQLHQVSFKSEALESGQCLNWKREKGLTGTKHLDVFSARG